MICSCARGKKSRLGQQANRDRICCAHRFTISKRGRLGVAPVRRVRLGREHRDIGVSQQILTESGNPTPISFASNSFASQDMLTDPIPSPLIRSFTRYESAPAVRRSQQVRSPRRTPRLISATRLVMRKSPGARQRRGQPPRGDR